MNPEAAGGISAVRAGGNVAAINGGYVEVYTAERYAERAWPLDDSWRLISIDTTKYSFDAVSQTILDDFQPNTIRVPDSAVDRLVNGSQDPIVVLLPQTGEPPQPPDSQLIQRLRDKFPKIIWLVHTGPDVPDYLLDSYPQLTIRILEPHVDLQTEIAQLLLFEKTRNFIDEQLHRSL